MNKAVTQWNLAGGGGLFGHDGAEAHFSHGEMFDLLYSF